MSDILIDYWLGCIIIGLVLLVCGLVSDYLLPALLRRRP